MWLDVDGSLSSVYDVRGLHQILKKEGIIQSVLSKSSQRHSVNPTAACRESGHRSKHHMGGFRSKGKGEGTLEYSHHLFWELFMPTPLYGNKLCFGTKRWEPMCGRWKKKCSEISQTAGIVEKEFTRLVDHYTTMHYGERRGSAC